MSTTLRRRRQPPNLPGVLRSIAPTLAGVLLVLAVVGPALGHSDLVSSDPSDKAILTTPPAGITLTFSEDLDPAKSSFRLVGPAGAVGTGMVADDPTLMTLGGLDLAPGAYEIQWTSAALDGDILRGTLTFTVSEPTPAPATPTPGPSATAAASAAASSEPSVPASGAPAPTPAPSAAPTEPAASSGDVVLPIVAALALVAVIGVAVLRRGRRA